MILSKIKCPYSLRFLSGIASICLLAFLLSAPVLNGADLVWANPGTSGVFETDTNWNPAQVPVNSADTIFLGTGVYTVTKTSTFSAIEMTIEADVLLENQGGKLGWKEVNADAYSNAGTIHFTTADAQWDLHGAKTQHTVFNSGLIQADGIELEISGRSVTVDNTGGTIEAMNSGTLNQGNTSIKIKGGTYQSDATSNIINDGSNRTFTMEGVTIVNDGYNKIVENTGGESGNIQKTGYAITTGGSFNNSGTVLIENRAIGDRRSEARVELSSDSTFSNTGTITIDLVTTRDNAYAQVETNSNTLNEGIINVVHTGASVVGANHIYDSEARFLVSGADFTQTGAGSAVNLVNGGKLIANNVLITEGALTGNGIVSGITNIGSLASVSPGASIGVLEFDSNLTLAGAYHIEVDSFLDTSDLLTSSGAMFFDDAVFDVSVLDIQNGSHSFLVASAVGGITGTLSILSSYDTSYELMNSNRDLMLTVTIPEPGTIS